MDTYLEDAAEAPLLHNLFVARGAVWCIFEPEA